jgi:sporulation protein YlmC with PRC-barrel domain
MRGLAAVNSLIRHRILKPDGEQPGDVEESTLNLRSGRIAGAVLSLTGFSGIWEQDVTNSHPAETRH